jgi:hypothetical protein
MTDKDAKEELAEFEAKRAALKAKANVAQQAFNNYKEQATELSKRKAKAD